MAKMRNKKRLNSKQANRITLVICAVYFILMLINGISLISKPTENQAHLYWAISLVSGTLLLYIFFYVLVFDVNYREKEEKEEEKQKSLKDTIIKSLSYTDFQQVFLVTEECKFYAKLADNKNIHLVVKDKHDKEVYNAEIENYAYFNHHFKFHE